MTDSIRAANHTTSTAGLHLETPEGASSAWVGGSPEMVIAQAAMELEEAAGRNADASRQSRTAQRQLQRGALDEKRKAARLQLAAGLVSAAGQAAQGVASFASSSQDLAAVNSQAQSDQLGHDAEFLEDQAGGPDAASDQARVLSDQYGADAGRHKALSKRSESFGKLGSAAADAGSSVLRFVGEQASIAAGELEVTADEVGESADAADEARESAQRFADKAMQHMAEVEEAKHRAAMAALRG